MYYILFEETFNDIFHTMHDYVIEIIIMFTICITCNTQFYWFFEITENIFLYIYFLYNKNTSKEITSIFNNKRMLSVRKLKQINN